MEIFLSLKIPYPVCWHLYQLSRDEMMIASVDGITDWEITDQFQLFNLSGTNRDTEGTVEGNTHA